MQNIFIPLELYFQDLGNGNYQALFRITGITKEDIQTKFKLHIANEIGEADYKVILFMTGMPIGKIKILDLIYEFP